MKNVRSLLLLGALFAAPLFAQPIDQELPNEPLDLALWKSDVRIVLQDDAKPHIVVRAFRDGPGEEEVEGPTVRIVKKGATWRILRAAESQDVRLRVELTAELAQQIKISGSEINLGLQGPPIDFEEMASLRETMRDGGGEAPAPIWSDVTLALADSQADVFGVSGASVQGRNTYFSIRQSSNQLDVELDGGGAEIEQHRGELGLYGAGDYALRDIVGKTLIDLSGGSLEINVAEGALEGAAASVDTRIFEWAGAITLESRGGVLAMQNFRADRGQQITLDTENSEVSLEAIPTAVIDVKQRGGTLRVRDVAGKNKIETNMQAEVELERLSGAWTLLLQDSEASGEEISRLTLESYNSKAEFSELEDLELNAHGSEIVATDLQRLGRGSLNNSQARIEVIDGGRGEIDAQASSRATVSLSRPCFVLTGRPGVEQSASEEGLEVFGCSQGADRGPQDSEEEPTYLSVTYGGESSVEVRGF